jgi:exodeoxyribonuclease VII small subunit
MSEDSQTYTKAIEEIENIIQEIENEQPDMDELSTRVARALALIKFCKGKLRNTEEDIDKLLEDLSE